MIHTVGIADLKFASSSEDTIITYALGSCLGITVYDPMTRVGGMLHVMLPASSVNPTKAQTNPFMFVDTGVPKLFLESYKLGAKKERLVVNVAGGAAQRSEDQDQFQIGKRNILTLRKLLWKNGVIIKSEDIGGQVSRTMSLNVTTGDVTIRVNRTDSKL